MRVTEKALTSWLESEGYVLVEDDSLELWGWTSVQRRTVALHPRLKQFQRVPVLLHECFHVHYGHEGRQSQAVEDRINEEVARLLVDPAEYAFWESQYGWNTGGIAAALEVPRWVVEAYRRTLVHVSR